MRVLNIREKGHHRNPPKIRYENPTESPPIPFLPNSKTNSAKENWVICIMSLWKMGNGSSTLNHHPLRTIGLGVKSRLCEFCVIPYALSPKTYGHPRMLTDLAHRQKKKSEFNKIGAIWHQFKKVNVQLPTQ